MFEILLPMFFSRIFMVSNLQLKSLFHFESILVYGLRRWSSFIFYTYLSNFPNTIYEIDYIQPIVCSFLLWQILVDHLGMGLFLGCLFIMFHSYMCLFFHFFYCLITVVPIFPPLPSLALLIPHLPHSVFPLPHCLYPW